jgi:DNA-binding transcriptional MerR regulator
MGNNSTAIESLGGVESDNLVGRPARRLGRLIEDGGLCFRVGAPVPGHLPNEVVEDAPRLLLGGRRPRIRHPKRPRVDAGYLSALEVGALWPYDRVMSMSLTIREAATETGVSTHTLRYYERIGLLAPIGRAPGGHRRYTEADLGSIHFLTMLRATGMPILEMIEFVDLTRAGDHTVPWRIEVLNKHRDALRSRMANDAAHLEALDRKISIYEGMLKEARTSA